MKIHRMCSRDTTPPPAPKITVAIASAHVTKDGPSFTPNPPPPPRPAPRDPGYIEVAGWEPGTRLELINLSKNPTATFKKKNDVVRLKLTGSDLDQRTAGVWLSNRKMKQLGLEAGSSFRLRAVDAAGNASEPTIGRLRGDGGYGEQGTVTRRGETAGASRLEVLDGRDRRWMVFQHVEDDSPPETRHFEKGIALAARANGQVELQAHGTLEPGCRVEVTNGRTGHKTDGYVDEAQQLSIGLHDVKTGDTLFVRVHDQEGNYWDEDIEIRYSKKCKNGRAPTLGILETRLAQSIKEE